MHVDWRTLGIGSREPAHRVSDLLVAQLLPYIARTHRGSGAVVGVRRDSKLDGTAVRLVQGRHEPGKPGRRTDQHDQQARCKGIEGAGVPNASHPKGAPHDVNSVVGRGSLGFVHEPRVLSC